MVLLMDPKNKNLKKRLRQSCDNCRKRHRKCDGQPECSRCKRLGLKCVYSERRERERTKQTKQNLDSLHLKLMQQLEEVKRRAELWEQMFYAINELLHQNNFPTTIPQQQEEEDTNIIYETPECKSTNFEEYFGQLLEEPTNIELFE